MLDEKVLRRPDFLTGSPIRLADGQRWTLPTAAGAAEGGLVREPDYVAAVRAVARSEDEADALRNELALAICLLARNYDLGPEGFDALLSFRRDDPALRLAQRAFRELARDHARRLAAGADARPDPPAPPRGATRRVAGLTWTCRPGHPARNPTATPGA